MDFQLVAEAGRGDVFAADGDPGPGEQPAVFFFPFDADSEGVEEGVLGVFHEDEETGEMDDAAHVCVHVFDFPAGSDLVHRGLQGLISTI